MEFHYLCSINVRSGEQEYVIYELKSTDTPFTDEEYYREILVFCGYLGERLQHELNEIAASGAFEAWPYDDRMYTDPWVQEVTAEEYRVLEKYLH